MLDLPRIRVSVVYALPERAFCKPMLLSAGATIADAIEHSGIRDAFPGLEIRADRLAIFARRVAMDATLRDGDRVEILRPLVIDPKEARRRRARNA